MLLLDLSLSRIVDEVRAGMPEGRWQVSWKDVIAGPDASGMFDGCARFNGTSSKITITGLACPPTFTFSAWVRGGPLLAFHYATILGFGGDRPFFGLHRRRPLLLSGVKADILLPDAWTHIAVTQGTVASKLYINGELMNISSSLAPTGGMGLGIGCDMGRGYAWFQGHMAKVLIYDEALSEAALREIVEEQRSGGSREEDSILVDVPPELEGERIGPPASRPSHPVLTLLTDVEGTEEVEILSEGWEQIEEHAASDPPVPSSLPPPPPPPCPWVAHLPRLCSLQEAFPSGALRSLIAALEAGRMPSLEEGLPDIGAGVSLSSDFAYSGHLGAYTLDLQVHAAIVVRIDDAGVHQQVDFSMDLAGEELCVTATPLHPLVNVEALHLAFEQSARAMIEDKISCVLDAWNANPLRLLQLGKVLRPVSRSMLRPSDG